MQLTRLKTVQFKDGDTREIIFNQDAFEYAIDTGTSLCRVGIAGQTFFVQKGDSPHPAHVEVINEVRRHFNG